MNTNDSGRYIPAITANMELFAQNVADGLNQSDAYRAAYNSNAKLSTVHESASRLAANPRVVARIQHLQAETAQVLAERRAWDRERLVDEAEVNLGLGRGLGRINAANQSLEIIGKATGTLSDQADPGRVQVHTIVYVRPSAETAKMEVVDAEYRVIEDGGKPVLPESASSND